MYSRHSGRFRTGPKAVANPDIIYGHAMNAQFLGVLADHGITMDGPFLDCLGWSTEGHERLLGRLGERLADMRPSERTFEGFESLKEMLGQETARGAYAVEPLLWRHPDLEACLRGTVLEVCDDVAGDAATSRADNGCVRTVARMKELFGISDDEGVLCEFLLLCQLFSPLEDYYFRSIELNAPWNRATLSVMLGLPQGAIGERIRGLSRAGIIEDGSDLPMRMRSFRLDESILHACDPGLAGESETLCCRPMEGETLPLDAFHVPQADIGHVKALLSDTDDAPVHILLYGAPGTGKTAFARSVAADLGVRAWSVASRERDDDVDRRASLVAGVGIAAGSKGSIVVVDEAERLLNTCMETSRVTKDKAWLNDFLERPGRRIIWITNEVGSIDLAVRRRFSHSIHFGGLELRKRRELWDRILGEHKALALLPEDRREEFARNYDVPVAVIEKAVRQGVSLGRGKGGVATAAECVLKAHVTLSMNGKSMPAKPEPSKEYTLEGVCMAGSPEKLVDYYLKVDGVMREGTALRPTSGNALFYGPPGTGKTALARHIAHALQRECTVVPASRLLSPFPGETEQNIAKAFMDAERDGAVLVFDEADSLLYSRDIAKQAFESSFVNEFLMRLEECRGLCICTTNRREGLDRAAMRRFARKVEFTYAGPGQIEALYGAVLAPLASAPLSGESMGALCALQQLAPGDFHAVRSRHWRDEPGSVDPGILLEDLRREIRAKLEEDGRHVGF
jgi:SpoVK/Ycf46/Vps4 family AAA+-type ATPase